ncbi:PLP-dependent aminotransferase family protein [Microbacterium kyungheense]|uniref:GntR family transcriptional regulator/MocR family aminotransferase n=1 Tax=Microbacterium kyungheense TaxID=1263636 RepID=A0A543EQF7_9MICO|nr:PLP-dependent aminotransferase family protein [Microbacterium kyungheense]TQM23836.1 GntR family transcriptional regulator/MocR family aminotransferase [Microbacterium kyungheense]
MAELQTNSVAWETLLDLSSYDGPRHVRLEAAVRDAVAAGRLPAGAALPSSRLLAASLGVSRWVVTEVYGRLTAEGILDARTGSATRVAASVGVTAPRPAPAPAAPLRRPRLDLAPGVPDLRHAPRALWRRAVTDVLARTPDAELFRLDPDVPEARTAVAAYLARSRFARADAASVVVTHGATDGMRRVARTLRALGHTALLVEDPSWSRMRQVAAAEGLASVPVPVDEHGVDVAALVAASTRTGARAALVTPAHQFPVGAALSPDRREGLLAWARTCDGVVIEDDYDAEFRYDRRPVGALQAMAPDRVVLAGSLSKTASAALGVGWLVLPPALQGAVRDAGAPAPSTLDQLTLTRFLASGGLDRHLRAARTRYRRRREALLAALDRTLPECPVSGIAAGLHVVLDLPPGVRAADVVRDAEHHDLGLTDIRRYRVSPDAPAPERLVLGYGDLADALVDEAVSVLAHVVRHAGRGR